MLCSKLHCQKGFNLTLFSYEILLQEFVEGKPLAEKFVAGTPYTLHPTPYTLHPKPSTLNPKP